MTLSVAAGFEECLYVDNVKTGQVLDLEFQVINILNIILSKFK